MSESEKNIDPRLAHEGFARMYHFLTEDHRISDGAYRTYALLLKHAQQKGVLWAGVEYLARERGADTSTITRHLKELEYYRLITRKRRLGTSTLTYITNLADVYDLGG